MDEIKKIMMAIEPEVMELRKTVKEYESDTFSASAVGLTKDETTSITIELITFALQQLIDTDTLDGVRLSEELESIRPESEDNED